MEKVIIKSSIFALLTILTMYAARIYLHTDAYLSDVGGLQTFFGVFGILYGIMAAFVVFEVWNQYNQTTTLIDKEALGLERLFQLALYFRDDKFTKAMKDVIEKYAMIIINGKFQNLARGQRSKEAALAFRQISGVINGIKFDDDHDSVVFQQILTNYGELAQTRTERINQALARLPSLLKLFIYISSLFVLFSFVLTPFSNMYYGFFGAGALGFVLAMVAQLIEDLDNPFVGVWVITPEPFERALRHIKEDY